MDLDPDTAWRTDPVAIIIRPWAPTLSQHGLPQVVVVTRVDSAAARWRERRADAPGQVESKDGPARGSGRPKSQAKKASSAGADASGH